jgi:hypothetical protein
MDAEVRNRRLTYVRTERVLRHHLEFAALIDELNALAPAVPLPPGEYACPSEETFYILIGLRYEGAPEVQLGIAPAVCVGTAVLNLNEEKEFGASLRLIRLLDRLLESGPGANPR